MSDPKSLTDRFAPVLGNGTPTEKSPTSSSQSIPSKSEQPPSTLPPKETEIPHPSPKKFNKRKWPNRLRILAIVLLIGIGILLGLAKYLTTNSGIRTWILPQISKLLGIEIKAGRIEWHVLSSVKVDDLCLGPENKPLFKAKHLVANYDGREILRGNYFIQRLSIDSAALHLTEKSHTPTTSSPSPSPSNGAPRAGARGTFGFGETSPKLQSSSAKASEDTRPRNGDAHSSTGRSPWPPAKAGEVQTKETYTSPENTFKSIPNFTLSSLEIENLELSYRTKDSQTVLRNLQVKAKDIKPKSLISFNLESKLYYHRSENSKNGSTPNQILFGQLKSSAQIQVNHRFIPETAKLDLSLENLKGALGTESFDDISAKLTIDLSRAENDLLLLKQGEIVLSKKDRLLASLTAKGPLDIGKKEADLDIQFGPATSNLLNILFTSKQLDFQNTSLNYAGHVWVTKGGNLVTVTGKIEANPLNFSSPELPSGIWKPICLVAEHSLELDRSLQQIRIHKLNMDATQENKPWMKGILSNPMLISWAEALGTESQAGEADFSLQVFPFDLATISPLLQLPSTWKLHSGLLYANLKVLAFEQGRNLTLNGSLGISHLSLQPENLKIKDASLVLEGTVNLKNLKSARFQSLSIKLSESKKAILSANLDGAIEFPTKTGSGTIQFEAPLNETEWLPLKPIPNLKIFSGVFGGKLNWQLAKDRMTCKPDVIARDLTLIYQNIPYEQMTLAFNGNLEWSSPYLKSSDARLTAQIKGQPVGTLQGNFSLDTQTSNFTSVFKLANGNKALFSPIFSAWMPDKKLNSLQLNSEGEVKFNKGILDFKGKLDVKNLLVGNDSALSLKPLNANLSTDLTYDTNGKLSLRSLDLQLAPTPNSKNLFQITGNINQSPSLLFADLKIQGRSLDFTSYYDQLFPITDNKKSTNLKPPPSSLGSSSTLGQSPPSSANASPQPKRDISIQATIDSLQIHEFNVTDLNIPFRLKGDAIELTDARLKIGGAPLTATIRTEPGQGKPTYKFEAKTEGLALGPLVDVFKPELKGLVGGTLKAEASGSGCGISMPDLEQNLNGILQIAIRDAHLEKIPAIQKSLKQIGNILQSSDIINSSVNNVDASGKCEAGKLHTDNLHFIGSAVETTLRGDLYLNQRLDMEAGFKIRREVIGKSSLLAPLLQTVSSGKEDWMKLPRAAKVTGTLSDPDIQIDASKLATDALINTGGNILKNILQEKAGGGNSNQNQNQQEQKPEDSINNLLKGLFKKKK